MQHSKTKLFYLASETLFPSLKCYIFQVLLELEQFPENCEVFHNEYSYHAFLISQR